ncbi:hypothetical protein IHE55_00975 [Streptomyces pactum]|uniref:Uncharacterized protein n=1 Tax=Streptomyces pactum TaxID=68249 RepID=A0ABS0NE29_9ACTN|nr:hypothetical protein [Streptomyces pactum]MBH5333449.1 hypothetical protein [Streptomyces pactum]
MAPRTQAEPAADGLPLDLPLANADGELAGGVHPDLPTDRAVLESWLARARAEHLPPARYAALLWQYWLVRAADRAGLELATWDPALGVDANDRTVTAVYGFYGRLFLDHPELQWAGMANMIGPAFTAGFKDLDGLADLAGPLAGKLQELPPEVRAELPYDVRQLAEARNALPAEQLRWFERKFLAMQKHIFMDQGAMHEAYLNGGLNAVEEMRDAGLVDEAAVLAWRDIAGGDPDGVRRGNTALLSREQNQIIADQWDQMYRHDGPVGAALTYGMTVGGSASIPGTRTPGRYAPLVLRKEMVIGGTVSSVGLTTPLPGFNLARTPERWAYITGDTLPAYQRLLREDPERARSIVASSFPLRVAGQRLALRWPQVLADLLTGWRLEIGTAAGTGTSGTPAASTAS